MSELTLSHRQIGLILASIILYFYLSDVLRSKSVQDIIKTFVKKVDNHSTHTILDNLETANTVAGITSITSVAIINNLPVLKCCVVLFMLFYYLYLGFFAKLKEGILCWVGRWWCFAAKIL